MVLPSFQVRSHGVWRFWSVFVWTCRSKVQKPRGFLKNPQGWCKMGVFLCKQNPWLSIRGIPLAARLKMFPKRLFGDQRAFKSYHVSPKKTPIRLKSLRKPQALVAILQFWSTPWSSTWHGAVCCQSGDSAGQIWSAETCRTFIPFGAGKISAQGVSRAPRKVFVSCLIYLNIFVASRRLQWRECVVEARDPTICNFWRFWSLQRTTPRGWLNTTRRDRSCGVFRKTREALLRFRATDYRGS